MCEYTNEIDEKLERIRAAAYDAGYKAGYDDGYFRRGTDELAKAGDELESQGNRFRAIEKSYRERFLEETK